MFGGGCLKMYIGYFRKNKFLNLFVFFIFLLIAGISCVFFWLMPTEEFPWYIFLLLFFVFPIIIFLLCAVLTAGPSIVLIDKSVIYVSFNKSKRFASFNNVSRLELRPCCIPTRLGESIWTSFIAFIDSRDTVDNSNDYKCANTNNKCLKVETYLLPPQAIDFIVKQTKENAIEASANTGVFDRKLLNCKEYYSKYSLFSDKCKKNKTVFTKVPFLNNSLRILLADVMSTTLLAIATLFTPMFNGHRLLSLILILSMGGAVFLYFSSLLLFKHSQYYCVKDDRVTVGTFVRRKTLRYSDVSGVKIETIKIENKRGEFEYDVLRLFSKKTYVDVPIELNNLHLISEIINKTSAYSSDIDLSHYYDTYNMIKQFEANKHYDYYEYMMPKKKKKK